MYVPENYANMESLVGRVFKPSGVKTALLFADGINTLNYLIAAHELSVTIPGYVYILARDS